MLCDNYCLRYESLIDATSERGPTLRVMSMSDFLAHSLWHVSLFPCPHKNFGAVSVFYDSFVLCAHSTISRICFFLEEDKILIQALRNEKGYGAKKIIRGLPTKEWKLPTVNTLLRKLRDTLMAPKFL